MKKLTILAVFLGLWAGLCPAATVKPLSPILQLAQNHQAIPQWGAIQKLAQDATRKKFPNANSALLWDATVARYDQQGLGEEYSHSFTKVLTEKGVRDNRQIALHFSATYGSVKVLKLAIHRPGKPVLQLDPARLSKISISSGQMGQNIYDPQQKVLRVGVPGLNVGDILEIAWQRTTVKARIPGMWSNYLLLQYNEPILRSKIIVDAPQKLPLRKIAVKGELPGNPVQFTETRQQDRIIYTWSAKNAPQIIPEPSMPEIFSCARRLLLSTAPSWESVSKWYAQLCRPALDAVDQDMKNFVKKLIANHKTDRDKVRALFLFVSQQIRYMGLTTETAAPGYEPHPVKVTFHNRYGVCRDKAALLAALLELANFKAYPTLIMVGDPKDDEVPNNYFNHAVVAWESAPGHYELLDPTYESTTEFFPALQMNMSYLVAKPAGEKLLRTPIIPPEQNAMKITTQGAIDFMGRLTATCDLQFGGVNDLFYRNAFSMWSSELKKQFFNLQLRKNFPGAELSELKITPQNIRDMNTPLRAQFKFTVSGLLPLNRRTFLLPIPQLSRHFGALPYVFSGLKLNSRHYPLKFDSTCQVAENFELALPDSVEILALPRARKWELPGVFSTAWQIHNPILKSQGGKISGRSTTSLQSLQITPQEYLKLKQVDAEAQVAQQELPVIRTNFQAAVPSPQLLKLFAGNDSLLVNSQVAYKIISPHEYQMTTTTRRKILSYAGVKKFSELKIPYNPATCQIEIEAEVIAPNGQVKKLTKSEINRMDAPWNAAAPRYPGSKILVATLPGVVPGATVCAKITARFSHLPFFAARLLFAGYSPAACREYTITAPAKMRLQLTALPSGVQFKETHNAKTHEITRSWKICDTPRIKREIHAAPLWFYAPNVTVSSGTYAQYSQQMALELRKRAAVTPAIKKFVAAQNWTKLASEEAKITAVRYYIDKFIRPAGPDWGEIPYTKLAEYPEITLQSGYGNSADRAMLTASLLTELGIENRFVLASSLGYSQVLFKQLNRAPQENVFDQVLVYLPRHNFYLNDSSRYAPLGSGQNEGNLALDLRSGRLLPIQVKLQRDTEERTSYRIVGKADDSAIITVSRELYGNLFAKLHRKLANFTPELRKRYFDSCAWQISREARILGVPESDFRSYPGRITYQVLVPHFIIRSGTYAAFSLPGYERFGQLITSSGAQRSTPIWRNTAERLRLNYQIELPPDFALVPGRSPRRELGHYGSSCYEENFYAEGNSIRFEARVTLPVELIAPRDCDELAYIQQELNALNAKKIILRQKSNRAARKKFSQR